MSHAKPKNGPVYWQNVSPRCSVFRVGIILSFFFVEWIQSNSGYDVAEYWSGQIWAVVVIKCYKTSNLLALRPPSATLDGILVPGTRPRFPQTMCCCDQLWKQQNPCCGRWRHGEAFIGIIQKPSLVYGMVRHDITIVYITCMNWFMLCAHLWNCFFDFTHALKLIYSIHWQPVVQVQYTVNLRQVTWNDMQPCTCRFILVP